MNHGNAGQRCGDAWKPNVAFVERRVLQPLTLPRFADLEARAERSEGRGHVFLTRFCVCMPSADAARQQVFIAHDALGKPCFRRALVACAIHPIHRSVSRR